jgi:hypothetical protein
MEGKITALVFNIGAPGRFCSGWFDLLQQRLESEVQDFGSWNCAWRASGAVRMGYSKRGAEREAQ